MPNARGAVPPLFAALALALLPCAAAAQAAWQGEDALRARAFVSPRLRPRPEAAAAAAAPMPGALAAAGWRGRSDPRTGGIASAEGPGIPWVPGRGNRLAGEGEPDLAALERAARAFLPGVEALLGVDGPSLVLSRGRSGRAGDLWNVDFDVVRGGLPVAGARVVFRVGHGNLLQMGSENLPSPGARVPTLRLGREQALAAAAELAGGFTESDTFLDRGSLHLLPAAEDDPRFAEGFEPGHGRGLALVWQIDFRRKQVPGTWRVRVDAASGEILELRDTDVYARVTGGVLTEPSAGGETVLPLPFLALSSGEVTDAAGWFEAGGEVTAGLSGPYVRVHDWCGPVSQESDWSGDVAFGTSPGGDCAAAGDGGAGNTRAARSQFLHLNRAREAARAWLPGNAWLAGRLTAYVNLSRTCNAYWDGTSVHFFRSGGGCGNTGEIASVGLHEYGHGLDHNDGNGLSPDLGTAEAYGDFTAALATRSSCIGPGFRTTPCGGYGDPCTECTGVRDLDWQRRASGTPHRVDSFTRLHCPADDSYAGPCGRQGHCESYVASEALWDLAARDLPREGPGAGDAAAWATAERLWYLSRATATSAFTCNTGGTGEIGGDGETAWTSHGCGIGSLWKTMRAADDDDGDLANGTPHSCHLFAAFDRHGIACREDPGADVCFSACSPPPAPGAVLAAGEQRIEVSWTAAPEAGGAVYDVYRAEGGCGAPFRKIADGLAGGPYLDTAVVPGTVYAYRLAAHGSGTAGNGACTSPPGACSEAVPAAPACAPPAAPAALAAAAAGLNRVDLSWPPAAGAEGYNVYRSEDGEDAARVATVAAPAVSWTDLGLAGGTAYEYRVRAFAAGCESASSPAAAASTDPCSPAVLFSDGFESGSGMGSWSAKTVGFNGSTEDWRGAQACAAHGGTRVLRFGGGGCAAAYGDHQFAYAEPAAGAGLPIPPDSTGTRLSFWHRRGFEDGFDGALLLLAVDGGPRVPVPASALSGAVYDATVAPICPPGGALGLPVFTGSRSVFEETVVDLDAACDAATGGQGGCTGRTLSLGFAALSDCSGGGTGWFLDDVALHACVAPPAPQDFHTVAPCRLLDTRSPAGPTAGLPLAPGSPRVLALAGACGIPPAARALAVNITAVEPAAAGGVRLSAADRPAPAAGRIPFAAGRTRAAQSFLSLPSDGSGAVRLEADAAVHLVLDVSGYFQPEVK